MYGEPKKPQNAAAQVSGRQVVLNYRTYYAVVRPCGYACTFPPNVTPQQVRRPIERSSAQGVWPLGVARLGVENVNRSVTQTTPQP